MLPTRNVAVKDRVKAILDSLPADRSFTLDDIKDAVRASGIKSRAGIQDYLNIYLKRYIKEDGSKYRLE